MRPQACALLELPDPWITLVYIAQAYGALVRGTPTSHKLVGVRGG